MAVLLAQKVRAPALTTTVPVMPALVVPMTSSPPPFLMNPFAARMPPPSVPLA